MTVNLVESVFDTYQGEYPLLGAPVKLVRFQGCNLANNCPLDCDTKHSWSLKEKLIVNIESIKPQSKYQNLMITGGEPFMQIDALFKLIKHWISNFKSNIIIETNGTLITNHNLRKIYNIAGDRIFISVSPKNNESFISIFDTQIPIESFRKHISFKIVVNNYLPPLNWIDYLKHAIVNNHSIYLMPEGITSKQITQNLKHVELFGKQLDGNYTLSPRCHIFLGIK